MELPTNDAGIAYRQALNSLISAVEHQAKMEHNLERAKHEVGNKREQLNATVIKMLASLKKEMLGPDGGK